MDFHYIKFLKNKNPGISAKVFLKLWCEPGLNRRHMDFQSIALPTELSHHPACLQNPFRGCKNKGILFK